jgi:hypothetical protein
MLGLGARLSADIVLFGDEQYTLPVALLGPEKEVSGPWLTTD